MTGSRTRALLRVRAADFACVLVASLLAPCALAAKAATAVPADDVAAAVAGLERREGLVPMYTDRKGGRILLALHQSGPGGALGRFLYQVYIRAGLGAAPVGLDRSAASDTQILAFRRAGKAVYAELENVAFRADGGSDAERTAVRDSFARSIVWSGPIAAESTDGTVVLLDVSGFLTRDAFGVVDALAEAKQGDFHLNAALSYPDVAGAAAFPENLEFEAYQTFSADKPGSEVQGIAPDPHSVTLIEHHSLIRLPAPGFRPRPADARTGAISSLVADYAVPLGAPTVYRLAHRFRLEKTDPAAARSPVVKPIVFYVDRAAPEPVRTALVEGARWWSDAFSAAGFVDAFRVEVLPEGISPLDARYNVINWVHRQTRGWSYGMNIVDPRTGEIVKGGVLLGSLRVRQDRMIFEGLAGAERTGSGGADDPIEVSLARLRQLAVHETGHALGLEHNFAASTYDDRASVMDYPAPRIRIVDGHLDFGDAYKVGIGSWDRFAIRWLYDEAGPGKDQAAELDAIVADGYAHGQRFVADDDARPAGSSHARGALWDDGPDPVAELAHVLEVRRIALQRFGPASLPRGAPLSDLRRVLVPVYLFHRYEVDAVSKLIGGADFTYATKGDGLVPSTPVSPSEQRRALRALLDTMDPAVLDLPDALVDELSTGILPPRDHAYDIEVFGDPHAPAFSLQAAAAAAADVVLRDLLEPSRLNRVLEQGARGGDALGLPELLATTVGSVFGPGRAGPHAAALRRAVESRLVAHLAAAAADRSIEPAAAASIEAALDDLGQRLGNVKRGEPEDVALARHFSELLKGANRDKAKAIAERDAAHPGPPPGMPIGEDDWFGDVPW